MTASTRRAAAVVACLSPLAASAGVVARSVEGPADGSELWGLLGAVAPVLLWGLPLAYVVFTVATLLPLRGGQKELERPRDATFVDRLSMFGDSREGW